MRNSNLNYAEVWRIWHDVYALKCGNWKSENEIRKTQCRIKNHAYLEYETNSRLMMKQNEALRIGMKAW